MADFTLTPDYTFSLTPTYDTLIAKFENGVEQRRPRRSGVIRQWTLQYRNRSSSDYQTVRNFYDSKLGSYASFTWTNPDDWNDYTVRFKDDSFQFDLIAGAANSASGIYNFDFDLIEVI